MIDMVSGCTLPVIGVRVVSRTGVSKLVLFSARSVGLGYGRSEC